MSTFRREKTYKSLAYMIIDNKDGLILNISSGRIKMNYS